MDEAGHSGQSCPLGRVWATVLGGIWWHKGWLWRLALPDLRSSFVFQKKIVCIVYIVYTHMVGEVICVALASRATLFPPT